MNNRNLRHISLCLWRIACCEICKWWRCAINSWKLIACDQYCHCNIPHERTDPNRRDESSRIRWSQMGCFKTLLAFVCTRKIESWTASSPQRWWATMSSCYHKKSNLCNGVRQLFLDVWRCREKHVFLLALSCHGRFVEGTISFLFFNFSKDMKDSTVFVWKKDPR